MSQTFLEQSIYSDNEEDQSHNWQNYLDLLNLQKMDDFKIQNINIVTLYFQNEQYEKEWILEYVN